MKTVFIGRCEPFIVEHFHENSYTIEFLNGNLKVDSRLSNHADLSLLRISEQKFIADTTQKAAIRILKNAGFEVTTVDIEGKASYPSDCVLNFAVCGGKVFGTKKALTDELKIDINRYGMCFVNVNQGYAKCSTVIFADRAAITEDESIYKAMSSNGTDCLLIRKGYVRLDGFDYGFIGGASAVDEENKTIIFFGDIEKHPDYSLIKSFIEKYAYSIEYIREKPLTDVGGAIII